MLLMRVTKTQLFRINNILYPFQVSYLDFLLAPALHVAQSDHAALCFLLADNNRIFYAPAVHVIKLLDKRALHNVIFNTYPKVSQLLCEFHAFFPALFVDVGQINLHPCFPELDLDEIHKAVNAEGDACGGRRLSAERLDHPVFPPPRRYREFAASLHYLEYVSGVIFESSHHAHINFYGTIELFKPLEKDVQFVYPFPAPLVLYERNRPVYFPYFREFHYGFYVIFFDAFSFKLLLNLILADFVQLVDRSHHADGVNAQTFQERTYDLPVIDADVEV